MPKPIVFPCGTADTPPCPPQPAAVTNEPVQYTLSDMKAHGQACYEKGRKDATPGA